MFTLRNFSPVQVRWNRPLGLHRRSPVHQHRWALSQPGWPEVRHRHHCTAIYHRSHQWHSDPDHFHRSYNPCGPKTCRPTHQQGWQFSKKKITHQHVKQSRGKEFRCMVHACRKVKWNLFPDFLKKLLANTNGQETPPYFGTWVFVTVFTSACQWIESFSLQFQSLIL